MIILIIMLVLIEVFTIASYNIGLLNHPHNTANKHSLLYPIKVFSKLLQNTDIWCTCTCSYNLCIIIISGNQHYTWQTCDLIYCTWEKLWSGKNRQIESSSLFQNHAVLAIRATHSPIFSFQLVQIIANPFTNIQLYPSKISHIW